MPGLPWLRKSSEVTNEEVVEEEEEDPTHYYATQPQEEAEMEDLEKESRLESQLETQLPQEEARFETQPATGTEEEEQTEETNMEDETSAVPSQNQRELETQPMEEEPLDTKLPSTPLQRTQRSPSMVRFPPPPTDPKPSFPPRNPFYRNRLQSISKPTFTNTPSDQLPSFTTMITDQLEYACHNLLACKDPTVLLHYKDTVMDPLLPVFWTCCPDTSRTAGRIYSRLQLAALTTDMAATGSWTAADWSNAAQQLMFVRGTLLRINANDLLAVEDDDEDQCETERESDAELQRHEMMRSACEYVVMLLRLQSIFRQFQAALLRSGDDDDTVEEVCATYRRILLEEYSGSVPEKLQCLLVVGDLYSPRGRAPQRDWTAVKERLLQRLDRLRGEGDYSADTAVTNTRSLLLRWEESILDIPTLVKHGYGDVLNPDLDKRGEDDDDVSSMGGEADDFRSLSVTEEDKETISQLASVNRTPVKVEDDEDEQDPHPLHIQLRTETEQERGEADEEEEEPRSGLVQEEKGGLDEEGVKESNKEIQVSHDARSTKLPQEEPQTKKSKKRKERSQDVPVVRRPQKPYVFDDEVIPKPKCMKNFRQLLLKRRRMQELAAAEAAKENNITRGDLWTDSPILRKQG